MGGRNERNDVNRTQQIDARQLDQSRTDFRYDFRSETRTDFDLEDRSAGNITAGGNVTVQSVDANVAEEQRRATEALAEQQEAIQREREETERRRLEEQRRIEEEREETRQREAEENRRILEANNQTLQEIARQQSQQVNAFTSATVSVSQEALKQNSVIAENAFTASRANFAEATGLLRDAGHNTKSILQDNLATIDGAIKDANASSASALNQAFRSTVGGFAESQQRTLLIGLGVVVVAGAVVIWLGNRNQERDAA